MNSMNLILASASPRRRELLTQAGYRFEVQASSVSESRRPGEDAIRFATRLAREKAEEVFARLVSAGSRRWFWAPIRLWCVTGR